MNRSDPHMEMCGKCEAEIPSAFKVRPLRSSSDRIPETSLCVEAMTKTFFQVLAACSIKSSPAAGEMPEICTAFRASWDGCQRARISPRLRTVASVLLSEKDK